jgi:hypothetical protein
MSASSIPGTGNRSHVIISAPSQWGQQACFHLLNWLGDERSSNGKVTLIIPRRYQHLFESQRPSINAWKEYPSLKVCLDTLIPHISCVTVIACW